MCIVLLSLTILVSLSLSPPSIMSHLTGLMHSSYPELVSTSRNDCDTSQTRQFAAGTPMSVSIHCTLHHQQVPTPTCLVFSTDFSLLSLFPEPFHCPPILFLILSCNTTLQMLLFVVFQHSLSPRFCIRVA